jgi:protein-tyrosine phosphatase
MEARLKEDILREASRCNNLLLVHDEIENGYVVPSWVAIDDIKTTREVFENLIQNNYRVSYVRIPISPEQAPEDRYLDEFVKVIKESNIQDPLVFNCGMGVGRSAYTISIYRQIVMGTKHASYYSQLRLP